MVVKKGMQETEEGKMVMIVKQGLCDESEESGGNGEERNGGGGKIYNDLWR